MSYIQLTNHIQFILRSETAIIKEAFRSLDATNGGIETYPISDYLLHSLFLRLTGAQEQKLKCICWEMACRDYEYRYERYERKPYGECSSYDDKCMVYNDLLNEIKKQYPYAYEISMLLVPIVYRYKKCYIQDDEISYIAIFVEHFLENVNQRLKAVIISSSRYSASTIVSNWLEMNFQNQIEVDF